MTADPNQHPGTTHAPRPGKWTFVFLCLYLLVSYTSLIMAGLTQGSGQYPEIEKDLTVIAYFCSVLFASFILLPVLHRGKASLAYYVVSLVTFCVWVGYLLVHFREAIAALG